MDNRVISRRHFLNRSITLAAAAPLALNLPGRLFSAQDDSATARSRADAKVAIVPCVSYRTEEVKPALKKLFDLLGGIGSLVKNKTVTVKLNLAGTNFAQFLNLPTGETY